MKGEIVAALIAWPGLSSSSLAYLNDGADIADDVKALQDAGLIRCSVWGGLHATMRGMIVLVLSLWPSTSARAIRAALGSMGVPAERLEAIHSALLVLAREGLLRRRRLPRPGSTERRYVYRLASSSPLIRAVSSSLVNQPAAQEPVIEGAKGVRLYQCAEAI